MNESEHIQAAGSGQRGDQAVADILVAVTELERSGKLAEARDRAIAAADRAAAAKQPGVEAVLLARASELALYTQGVEAADALARKAGERASAALDAGRPGSDGALVGAKIALARVCLRLHNDAALEEAEHTLDGIEDMLARARHRDETRSYQLSPVHQATRLKLRGLAWARRAQPRRALDCFHRGYRYAEGDAALRARILLTWAVQLRNWGLFVDARRQAERSLELRLQLGDHYGAAMCYGTLALIYQRQGMWERERDALAADIRECQRIGGVADIPGLQARLAGALVGMGKYAGAWSEAETAIAGENRRLGIDAPADKPGEIALESATRTHAFAWREQARVCLAQNRLDDGISLTDRARAVFARLRDRYGEALCRLTEAEIALAMAQTAGEPADRQAAVDRVARAVAAAQPVFVGFGALPEAAQTILVQVECEALSGDTERAAGLIAQQVLPMLRQAGLGSSPLFRRARECLQRLAPERALDRTVTQAAALRSLAAIMTETEPQPGTALAARVGDETRAHRFALCVVDHGGLVLWPDSHSALAVILGPKHAERAAQVIEDSEDLAVVSASGLIDLEHMWPAGVRARGEPIEAAIAGLRERAVAKGGETPS